MAAQTGLVDNLRPAARDQVKLRDRILRATNISAEQTARGNSTVLQWDMGAYASALVTFLGDSSSFAIDGSNDPTIGWGAIEAKQIGVGAVPLAAAGFYEENQATVGSIATTLIAFNKQTKFVRIRAVAASSSRNTSVQVTLTQTPFTATSPTRHYGADNAWAYTGPSGGQSGTTAVALASAPNPYHRRLLTQLELDSSGTAGTEVIVLDGSTPLWRGYLAASGAKVVQFDPPLRASANAALNVQLSAATNATVYVNARGLTTLA